MRCSDATILDSVNVAHDESITRMEVIAAPVSVNLNIEEFSFRQPAKTCAWKLLDIADLRKGALIGRRLTGISVGTAYASNWWAANAQCRTASARSSQ